MKAATDSIAVIRTRMPYLDRRALSEAWFSALHLAREGRVAVPQRRAGDPGLAAYRAPNAAVPRTQVATLRTNRAAPQTTTRQAARTASPERARPLEPPETTVRPRPVTGVPAARAVMPAPFDASFTLTIEGARVQMLVRRVGATLRVTAICAAAHLEPVRRALASADLAMRLRGHLVESSVRAAGDREVPA